MAHPFSRLSDPRPLSSHDQMARALATEILQGVYPPGANLPPEPELLARFGVSRTVLRETMKTLAAKRLVEPKAKVGTRVLDRSSWNFFDPDVLGWRCEAGIDQEFVKHLAEIRLALEPAAAAAAALQASNEDIVSLYVIAAKFDNPQHTPESIAKVDLEFHLAVAHMSGNPFMRSASGLIEAALAISFQLSSPAASPGTIAEIASNHLRIVHAIAARDADAAVKAMRHVIEVGKDRTQKAIKTV